MSNEDEARVGGKRPAQASLAVIVVWESGTWVVGFFSRHSALTLVLAGRPTRTRSFCTESLLLFTASAARWNLRWEHTAVFRSKERRIALGNAKLPFLRLHRRSGS